MSRPAVAALLVLFSCAALANDDIVAEVRTLRLAGELSEALAVAGQAVAAPDSSPQVVFDLHLERARIHDRFGLHHDARPVAAALDAIHTARAMLPELDSPAAADVELALADYYYRAEMTERRFENATRHVLYAIFLYQELADKHKEAEAVHRLGLIHLQKRELERARELFDESLRADIEGGARDFFRGEYERHVGFVYWLQDKPAAALPYFERSLEYRLKAGAIDASLFAAVSLASTLVELGRGSEAKPHLDYAFEIADRISSPVGRRRAEAVLARMAGE